MFRPPFRHAAWLHPVMRASCLAAAILLATACRRGEGVVVEVQEGGFSPSRVTLAKGAPGKIVFIRKTDDTCAKEVVFPELGLRRDLPLDVPVTIDVPTIASRTLGFQCGMGMYKSAVIVQ